MSSLHDFIKSSPSRPMREWADDFGISRPHLIALVDGSRNPSLDVARRIEKATSGKVPITSWPSFKAIFDAAQGEAAE